MLETYNEDFELQFTHQLKYIVGICKIATAHNLPTTSNSNKSKLTEFITFPNRRPQSTVIDEANAKAGIHGIVYLLKNLRDPLLHVYLFESPCLQQVRFFVSIKKKPPKEKVCLICNQHNKTNTDKNRKKTN